MGHTKAKYGIWSGRFQIIHKGQEFVLQYVDKNYPNVCIGIVNPIPSDPAWDVKEHEEFEISRNPFTYFQRVYLWNLLLRHLSIEAVIVPHWFPRKSLQLELTFLPYYQRSREWVFPNLQGEECKINDFEKAGERVRLMTNEEPDDLKAINSFHIKRMFDKRDKNFKADIPEVIQLKTEIFLKKEELDEDFIIIPILGDNLHPLLICGGIQLRFDINRKLIFAPVVHVQNSDNWWKFESKGDGYFTFYQKHEIINSIMKSIHFYDYMVVPIILKNNKCEKIEAFLPDTSKRSWFLIRKVNRINAFKQFQLEKNFGTNFDFHTISDDLLIEVYARECELFNEMNYYTNYYDDNESEEN